MQTRVAVMSIILEDSACAEAVNAVLHQYGQYIIGRMGIPYRQRNIHIISVAVDAPQDANQRNGGQARADRRRQHQDGVFELHERHHGGSAVALTAIR